MTGARSRNRNERLDFLEASVADTANILEVIDGFEGARGNDVLGGGRANTR